MPSEKVEQIEPCLSIQEDIASQERGWKIQRTATYIIFGLMILIAAGLFGSGPLSRKTAVVNGVTVAYERFIHHNGNTRIDISAPATGSVTVVSFPVRYLDLFSIETVAPEPAGSHINGQEIVYTFHTSQASRLIFTVSALQWGRVNTGIKVNGQLLPLSYFIYP